MADWFHGQMTTWGLKMNKHSINPNPLQVTPMGQDDDALIDRCNELEALIRNEYFACAELDLREGCDTNWGRYMTMCDLWEAAFGEKPPDFGD